MKRINIRKTLSFAALIGATIVGATALADPPQGAYGHGYGMGPGMMGGYDQGFDPSLTAEQRSKIAKIQNDVRRKHWDLMGKMHDEQSQMSEIYFSDKRDDAALSKSYRTISDLRQKMFELSLNAQKQIDAVLTKEQRDKLKSGWHGMWWR
jgi:Spy/CpxP family protein refolding chaperone